MASRYPLYLRTIRAMTGCTHREAQLVWQRLESWLDHHDTVSAAAIRRHPKKVREYLALARGLVPAGRVVVISLVTKGGTYTRGRQKIKDRRPLYLTIFVTATRDRPIAEHERAVRLTMRGGAQQPGFRVMYADWEKGKGRTFKSGRIARDVAIELMAFYGALKHPNTEIRVAMLEEDE
jgi:hypothetical protein